MQIATHSDISGFAFSTLPRVLGLTFCNVWFSSVGSARAGDFNDGRDIYSLVVFTIFIVLSAVFAKRFEHTFLTKPLFCLILGALAGIASLLPSLDFMPAIPAHMANAVLSGVGMGVLIQAIGSSFCRISGKRLFLEIVGTYLIVISMTTLLLAFPGSRELVLIVLPVLAGFCSAIILRTALKEGEGLMRVVQDGQEQPAKKPVILIVQFLVAISLIGLVTCAMHNLSRFSGVYYLESVEFPVSAVKLLLLMCMLLVGGKSKAVRFLWVYRLTCFMLILGFLLFPLFNFTGPVPSVLTGPGHLLLSIFIWLFSISLCQVYRLSSVLIVGLSQGSLLGF
ncbi:MAG: hypothetical protein LBG81_05245 [Coriobacteriaceae bacterium]|jgi:hypothetical protein|nr:hypothetical protein [Coriobacteriaceae bacterium]